MTEPVYTTPFTAEAVVSLTDHLKASLKTYAEQNHMEGKMDFFVMFAALSQTAFEMAYGTLPRTEEERAIAQQEAKLIVDGLFAKLDGLRAEYKTRGSSDLIASAQFMSILAEVYCKRRDAAVMKMLEEQQLNTTEQEVVPEDSGDVEAQ